MKFNCEKGKDGRLYGIHENPAPSLVFQSASVVWIILTGFNVNEDMILQLMDFWLWKWQISLVADSCGSLTAVTCSVVRSNGSYLGKASKLILLPSRGKTSSTPFRYLSPLYKGYEITTGCLNW